MNLCRDPLALVVPQVRACSSETKLESGRFFPRPRTGSRMLHNGFVSTQFRCSKMLPNKGHLIWQRFLARVLTSKSHAFWEDTQSFQVAEGSNCNQFHIYFFTCPALTFNCRQMGRFLSRETYPRAPSCNTDFPSAARTGKVWEDMWQEQNPIPCSLLSRKR